MGDALIGGHSTGLCFGSRPAIADSGTSFAKKRNCLSKLKRVAIDGNSYHITCFRCAHGGCVISPSNYVAHEGRIYYKHHHSRLLMQKGNFSQLDKGEPASESTKAPVSEDSKQGAENVVAINGKDSNANGTESTANLKPEPTEETSENSV